MKIKIKSILKTCDACPAQWEGETEKGCEVYVRFRHGFGYIMVASEPGADVFAGETVFNWEGEPGMGVLSYQELIELAHQFEWPESD